MRQVENFDTRYRYPSFMSALAALVGYFSSTNVDRLDEIKDDVKAMSAARWANYPFSIEHIEAIRGPDTFIVREIGNGDTVLGLIFQYWRDGDINLFEYEVMPCPENWTWEEWKASK